jgi:opacity protein-like surface antigen
MLKKLLFVGTILLLVSAAAMAADAVTGKWRMEQEGFNGGPTRVSTFDFQADGAKLTGTLTQPGFGQDAQPMTTPISNGKVDGANLSFDVALDFGGNAFTLHFDCAITGTDMKVKITVPAFQGGDPRTFDATAKKQ